MTDEPTMTRAQALRKAADQVTVVSNGPRQYVLHTWSPRHNATQVSHSMDIYHAQAFAWEKKVYIALEFLGIPPEDAMAEANAACDDVPRGDWRKAVRRIADRLQVRK